MQKCFQELVSYKIIFYYPIIWLGLPPNVNKWSLRWCPSITYRDRSLSSQRKLWSQIYLFLPLCFICKGSFHLQVYCAGEILQEFWIRLTPFVLPRYNSLLIQPQEIIYIYNLTAPTVCILDAYLNYGWYIAKGGGGEEKVCFGSQMYVQFFSHRRKSSS